MRRSPWMLLAPPLLLGIGCLVTTSLDGISDGVPDEAGVDDGGDDGGVSDGDADAARDTAKPDAPPDPCAEASGTAWTKPVKLALAGPGGEPGTQPYVLPDGLSLVFAAKIADKWHLFLAKRASTTAAFSGATPITFDTTSDDWYAAAMPGLQEIVYASAGKLYAGTRVTGSGPYFSKVYPPPVNSGVDGEGGAWATLGDEGRVLGYAAGPLFKWKLFEAHRTNNSPGASWTSAGELAELNDPPPGTYVTICPAYSADARRIWFTSNQTGEFVVMTSSRSSLGAKFSVPVPVPILTGIWACPRSITKNGCEMYLSCNPDGAGDAACVSKRVGAP